MAARNQLDQAIAKIDDDIRVLQFARQRLVAERDQQRKPKPAKEAKPPRLRAATE